MFEGIEYGPKDPMFDLKKRADGDTSAAKVDLGVGIYRNEDGVYQQPQVLRQAKQELLQNDPGHDVKCTHATRSRSPPLIFLANSTRLPLVISSS